MDIRVRVPAQMQTLNTNKNMGATWKRYFVSIPRAIRVLVAVFVKRFMVIYDIMNLSIQEIVLRKTYGSPSKFFIKIKHFLFYFILLRFFIDHILYDFAIYIGLRLCSY